MKSEAAGNTGAAAISETLLEASQRGLGYMLMNGIGLLHNVDVIMALTRFECRVHRHSIYSIPQP